MFPSAESGLVVVYQLAIVLSLNTFVVQCAPLLPRTNDGFWDENMVDCSPGGRCWEWSRKQQSLAKPDYYEDPLRVQSPHSQDSNRARTAAVGLPSTTRISKKDVFMSRGWGAGGMPFSVLYMHPHSQRSNSNTGANEIEPARALPLESPALPSLPRNSNNRVALRNGASGQPRRQYSIIPQLFVSYGWGPHGK
ncbi:uncharacterized protein LOC105685199 [Athalia rosae]|uniref:uncharacterized protein LOC105685199 n=1 Tax=Athalia rosae TaxID=37344 RepID=UPI0006251F23|nr:uncharacterized protein LOC105685199 [Athalia rosae]XP_012254521.1 uncharacterized protein LOC105685199 [Athalia rosae]XP_012254530.1 uncharacterized protein LOC105685199 [Athalia rosae]